MIREAVFDDIPDILPLAAQMHRGASEYRDVPWNNDDAGCFIAGLIDDDRSMALAAIDADRNICGFMGAKLCPFFFNVAECYAIDVSLYVSPKKRLTGHAVRLIRRYEQWARSKGLPDDRILLGQTTTPDEKLHDFYIKMGYIKQGYLFRKNQ